MRRGPRRGVEWLVAGVFFGLWLVAAGLALALPIVAGAWVGGRIGWPSGNVAAWFGAGIGAVTGSLVLFLGLRDAFRHKMTGE